MIKQEGALHVPREQGPIYVYWMSSNGTYTNLHMWNGRELYGKGYTYCGRQFQPEGSSQYANPARGRVCKRCQKREEERTCNSYPTTQKQN